MGIREDFISRSTPGSVCRELDEKLLILFDKAGLGQHEVFETMLKELIQDGSAVYPGTDTGWTRTISAKKAKARAYRLLAKTRNQFTPLQQTVAELYDGGAMSDVSLATEVNRCDDDLFRFLIHQAAAVDGDATELIRLVAQVRDKLTALEDALAATLSDTPGINQ